MSTCKQDVVTAKSVIADRIQEYSLVSLRVMKAVQDDVVCTEHLLDLQLAGNRYFNYVENFVGDSDLLGAHETSLWVQNFAEDCLAHLESLAMHFQLLNEIATITNNVIERPSSNAYASMQRMVKLYLGNASVKVIRANLKKVGVPTSGLDNALPMYKGLKTAAKPSLWAIILLLAAVGYSYFVPNPTGFQSYTVRTLVSLAGALFVRHIAGFIELKFGDWLKTGGPIAVFVLLYLVNPARSGDIEEKASASTLEIAGKPLAENEKKVPPLDERSRHADRPGKIDMNKTSARKQNVSSQLEPVSLSLPLTVSMGSDSAMLIPGHMIHGFRAIQTSSGGNGQFSTEQNKTVFLLEGQAVTITLGNVNYSVVLRFTPEGIPTLTVDK